MVEGGGEASEVLLLGKGRGGTSLAVLKGGGGGGGTTCFGVNHKRDFLFKA